MKVATTYDGPRTTIWFAQADEGRANPGLWFELTEKATEAAAQSFAYKIMIGRTAAFRPGGSFEGRTRGRTVFFRYVGGGDGMPTQEELQAQAAELIRESNELA